MPALAAEPDRVAVRALATLTLFTVLAGQFWRNLLGWWGFGTIVILVAIAAGVALIRLRPGWAWRSFPTSLVVFLGLATVSILWSFYPLASLAGVAAQWVTALGGVFLAACLSWAELLRALGAALRWVLGLSLLFELIVAVVVRHPVLPFWVDYGSEKVPQAFYWSRALLLHGGPIEGIVASRNLLGFFALLAVIVFAVQLAAGTVKRGWGIGWLVFALVMMVLTRSATVTVAAIAVAVAFLFAVWARRRGEAGRRPVYLVAAASVVAVIGGVTLAAPWLLSLFGKSEDLTGRLDIWSSVIRLAGERPVFGWGWVSYWAPWTEPFKGLAVRKGVEYLQAHDAWLDVWLQLGVVGVVAFAALALSTLWRAWFLAVDRPVALVTLSDPPRLRSTTGYRHLPHPASSLLPLLLMVALLAQSLAESRLLIEYGWLLLVLFAVATKRQQRTMADLP
ncbi:O-antigen ligase family protein [Cryobacterium tepidiphilum]|uniref:O-antigen ligase family protein n=1 Tax=Cryobacterium tepidiphilum TaxID=2486026 RepID=A0A3M8L0L7_9MICO|nr:O-antigen ligase family protein [Cryobacterium tepidiphilum]RNE59081.1 O-antigen ligase family protein [Cryobacterium tepidiphilum]